MLQGYLYKLATHNTYYSQGRYTGQPLPGTGINAGQVFKAWHHFMHALAVGTPRAVNRSRSARKRLRRVVR